MANSGRSNDIVRGFNHSQSSSLYPDVDMISLLQKVSSQLEQLQKGTGQNTGSSAGPSLPAAQDQQKGQMQQPNMPAQSNNGQEQTSAPANSNPNENTAAQELQNLFSQLLRNNSNAGLPQEQQQPENNGAAPASTVAVQTAGQILAKAQYELSNELENSLNKLKQVITESEKIAAQIGNLLDESNNKKA